MKSDESCLPDGKAGLSADRGIGLILVMGIFVILGTIAVALVTMSVSQMKLSHYTTDSKLAFHSAEAGIDYAIAMIPGYHGAFPDTPDIWITLPNQAKYKSGLPDTTPTPAEIIGISYLTGYSMELGSDFFSVVYDLTASGKFEESKRIIKARVKCGPLPSGKVPEY
ncbi:MAG: pilus assembly PilX N-terminal domain-containing protein [bacterium]|nr:pilus assembly PilX N-terminal domain-containing protein [bacterium]